MPGPHERRAGANARRTADQHTSAGPGEILGGFRPRRASGGRGAKTRGGGVSPAAKKRVAVARPAPARVRPSAPEFELEKIRADFPILRQKVRGKPLVYLDNAATSQKPQTVINAITR